MMEWLRKIIVPHFEDDELNRHAFNLNVILLTTLVVMLVGIVAMLLQIGKRPLSYVIPNVLFITAAAMILMLSYYLSRKGHVQAGSIIFTVMVTVVCIGAVVVGGTRSALPVILIIPIATASVTLGSGVSLALAFLSLTALMVTGFLEISGILNITYLAPKMTILLNMFDVGFGFFFVTMVIWLAGYSLRQALEGARQAIVEANRYRQELEKSLTAERAIAGRLQRAISEYTIFLKRIGEGDYEARLSLGEEDENLVTLEQHINATVDTLVEALVRSESALQEVEAAQHRYVLHAWRDYVRSRPATNFEVAQSGVTVPREQLRPALKEAVTQRRTLTLGQRNDQEGTEETAPYTAVVTPITLRGEVVGTLGICREAGERPWTDEERALVEAIAERLALAADNMRLLDETQRRAASEQLTGEVTARMRESLELETVLNTAVREIGRALGLAALDVRLGVEVGLGDTLNEGSTGE